MTERADLHKDPEAVAAMFSKVAPRYDLTNDLMSLFQDRGWRRHTCAAVVRRPGLEVLDVACGTGTSAGAFADAGAVVTGLDFSEGMLEQARRQQPDLRFVQGDAMDLPFPDASFDAVTISFGLRNVQDPARALAEFARVTRPGGHLVICEFSTPRWRPWRLVYRTWIRHIMPLGARVFSSNAPAYTYLTESILDWPDQVTLGKMIRAAGWESVAFKNLSGGIVALHRATKPAAS